MPKATKTIQHALVYQPAHGEWFAATQALYNRVVAFYFEIINAHEGLIDLSNKEAFGREVMDGFELGSPSLIRKGNQWWLHTPVEKKFTSPARIATQLTSSSTLLCAIDLNLGDNIAVCSVQTVEGTILATKFINGGNRIDGFRKRQLGRIARNRSQTGILAEGEQDNVARWTTIRNVDEALSHRISTRIVQFAKAHRASILVFEHLGNLKPETGMPALSSDNGSSVDIKKSLPLEMRIRKYQVYPSPKMPTSISFHHALMKRGMESSVGMAPPLTRRSDDGEVFLLYSFSTTPVQRGASTKHIPRASDYRGVEEAARFLTDAECHYYRTIIV